MHTVIESEGIRLVGTRPEDLDAVLALEQGSYNKQYVFSWTREEHMAAIEDAGCQHLIIIDMDNALVGYMILKGVDSADRSLEFMRLVIGPKGRGYGRRAVQLLKELAFVKLKCHRLWLDAYVDNTPAIRLYLDEGFIQEGILRECKLAEEGYRSIVVMSMLEQEYFA